nr:MAG TPA: hypothetical protein [Herelleviridae sp.]
MSFARAPLFYLLRAPLGAVFLFIPLADHVKSLDYYWSQFQLQSAV